MLEKMNLIFGDKKFSFFFWTQFLGAFNDNVFKNALVILITYKSITLGGMGPEVLVPLAGGLFILPYLLFSAIAGQMADTFQKSVIMRRIKLIEIMIMFIAGVGFYLENFFLLMGTLFLMGVQSTFFGPLKYSIVPALVDSKNLISGNAFITGGTFSAILLGTILGGFLPQFSNYWIILSCTVLSLAVLGWLTGCQVPSVPVYKSREAIDYTLFRSFWKVLKLTWRRKDVFRTLIGISYFWFLGAAILSLLPLLAKDIFGGGEKVATLFLTVFVVGMGIGSFVVKKISPRGANLGFFPFSLLGIGLVLIDAYFVLRKIKLPVETIDGGLDFFLAGTGSVRIVLDLLFLSILGGVYVVSGMTWIQEKVDGKELARIISGNNIWNAGAMVLSAGVVIWANQVLGIVGTICMLGITTVLFSIVSYAFYSEYAVRLLFWVLCHCFYKLTIEGRENIPQKGPVILVGNHVSFLDWLFLFPACPRPINFVLAWNFYYVPFGPFIFKQGGVIPIATRKQNEDILREAFEMIRRRLEKGKLLGIFPEGKLTRDGKVNRFLPGVSRIAAENPTLLIIPFGLDGPWWSIFSRRNGKVFFKRPVGFRIPIRVSFGKPIPANEYNSRKIRKIVAGMVSHAGEE